jgi:hypothetical protein
VVGRRLDGRPDDLPPHRGRTDRPPPPARGARRQVQPASGPSTGRVPRAAGPLVAEREPAPRPRPPEPEPSGRFRRFVHRYGWRAYAVPVLAVATVVTLVDLTLTSPDEVGSTDAGATAAITAPASVAPTETQPAETVAPGPTDSADVDEEPTASAAPPTAEQYVEQGQGAVSVVDGSSEVMGKGPLRRFAVEVENGIDVDAQAFAEAVEKTLGDSRSWGHAGRMSFQRVGRSAVAAGNYDFKVSLISPGSMERYCPGVGTGGYTSCRYGERAVINLARWATAVPDYEGDIATYRLYVVNHEVGHVLGHGHEPCPGRGRQAPVMQQQTLGLKGCTKNAWPYP